MRASVNSIALPHSNFFWLGAKVRLAARAGERAAIVADSSPLGVVSGAAVTGQAAHRQRALPQRSVALSTDAPSSLAPIVTSESLDSTWAAWRARVLCVRAELPCADPVAARAVICTNGHIASNAPDPCQPDR